MEMSGPEVYYSNSRSFSTSDSSNNSGSNNNVLMENEVEASSSNFIEMNNNNNNNDYENSLDPTRRTALPAQYFRYPLPVIPTSTASFPHSYLPSPFVPHYLSPPPLYYYQSPPYHHDALLQARYYGSSSSPETSVASEGKIHDHKWFAPVSLPYHPPLTYYSTFAPISPTTSEIRPSYLSQCYLDPYAAGHQLAYSQSPLSHPLLLNPEYRFTSKVTAEVFRPYSASTPNSTHENSVGGDEGNDKNGASRSEDGQSDFLDFSEQSHPFDEGTNQECSVEYFEDDGNIEMTEKRNITIETSSPRKRKILDSSIEDSCVDMNESGRVPLTVRVDDVKPREENIYYKAELSSATTIVLRRSPHHPNSGNLSLPKCLSLPRSVKRQRLAPAIETRNNTFLLKQKLYPIGVKPKAKRGRPRKYPCIEARSAVNNLMEAQTFVSENCINNDDTINVDLLTTDVEDAPNLTDIDMSQSSQEQQLQQHAQNTQPRVFLERINPNVTGSLKDNGNKSDAAFNSSDDSVQSTPLKFPTDLEDGDLNQCHSSVQMNSATTPECPKRVDNSEVSINLTYEKAGGGDDDTKSTQEIPEHAYACEEQPGEVQSVEKVDSEVMKDAPQQVKRERILRKTDEKLTLKVTHATTVGESKSLRKIEVIDITDKNEGLTKTLALPSLTTVTRRVRKDPEQEKRNIVFTTSSERALLRIPEKTLRLRVRGIDPVLNRKFKLKRDGPLFPKVPITYAEKKLEKSAISKMQTWLLNKEQGETYLHRAAKENDVDVTLYCLKFDGFHPRCTNNRGYTPLHEACKVGGVQVAKILLDHGAYHSQPAKGNIRPIHIASQIGHLELVQLLLTLGANPFLTTMGGTNCFDLAESHPNVLKLLTDYISILQTQSKTG